MELSSILDIIVSRSIGFPLEDRVKQALPAGECVVVSFGKSGLKMAQALEGSTTRVAGGVVVVPHGYPGKPPAGLELVEASHPVPDEGSLRAGEAVLEWARSSRGGCLLALISGGGSALVEAPVEPVSLEDLTEATRLLLASGASIHEINSARKHLSRVKGGRLAEEAHPARVYGLYASDVPGDRIDSIASGPTAPDPTTYRDALAVLRTYNVYDSMPVSVVKVLEEGAQGLRPETPKPGSPVFKGVHNRLVASNMDVLRLVAQGLEEVGYRAMILTSRLEGESREAGRVIASITMEAIDRGLPASPPAALLLGGGTTVHVRNPQGRGGRNMELSVSWAYSMWYWGYRREASIVSLDTDGIDGSTDAAGANLEPVDIDGMRSLGLDPLEALDQNNTYQALEAIGKLIRTGPTQINLNSITVVLLKAGRGAGQ